METVQEKSDPPKPQAEDILHVPASRHQHGGDLSPDEDDLFSDCRSQLSDSQFFNVDTLEQANNPTASSEAAQTACSPAATAYNPTPTSSKNGSAMFANSSAAASNYSAAGVYNSYPTVGNSYSTTAGNSYSGAASSNPAVLESGRRSETENQRNGGQTLGSYKSISVG